MPPHAHSIARQLFGTAALLLALLLAPIAHAATSNSLMDISADGQLLACSNRDSGTVSIIDLRNNKKLHEITVGHKPEGVTFIGPTHQLAVAVYHDDQIAFLDADTGKLLAKLDVLDEPYSLISTPKGDKLYATLSYPGKVLEIDPASRKITRTFTGGAFNRGLAISTDNSRLFITEFYTATVLSLDTTTGQLIDRWPATASDNLSRQITLHPTRPKAYLSHIRSATERAQGEGSIFPYVSIIDTSPAPAPVGDKKPAKRRTRIPMDSFIGTHVTANPWEVAITPDGKRFFSVFSGTDDLYACDVIDDDYREIRWRATIQLGHNPRAVRVAPDGKAFYVYNALDFNIVAYDTTSFKKLATIEVTTNPLTEEILQGKRLFYSALQPMVGRRWISCSSCHPDGETDLRTWQNPEGLRDTPPLGYMAYTYPLHWSADRDEVQDFEHTIRGQLMQGKGLMRARPNPALGPPNKGLSKDLDALAAYSNTHKLPRSPHAKSGLSESAQRGKTLFFSAATQCATCHSGPFYTDQKTHDVGTRRDDPSEQMPPAYDTPTLLGLYKSAPYLHHGKAATLTDLLTTQNPGDTHGKTSKLSAAEVTDLVEFLKALPYEDPEPQARASGMAPIER